MKHVPLGQAKLPWDALIDDPVETIRADRESLGDTFVVESGDMRYLFVFSAEGVRAFYAIDEAFGSFNIPQLSASCDPLFAAWATMTDDYLAAFDRLHAGPLRSSVIDPLLDTWVAQIEAATIEAAEANSQALNVTTWETAVDQLRATVDSQRENRPR